jgi:hypothetical protein
MIHAALLLLMLEAVQTEPRFTISLKRSTQKSAAIHKPAAVYPIFAADFRTIAVSQQTTFMAVSRSGGS